MRIKKDVELRNPREPISLKNSAEGDYVLYRLTMKWMKLTKLVSVKSVIYAECDDYNGNTHRVLASECFPSWNPQTKSFGREEGSKRKSYWLP